MKRFVLVLLAIMFVLCGCEEEVEKVSVKKPIAIVLKRERSYYQAQKIVRHFADLNIPAYIVEKNDENENQWFYVVTGAFKDTLSMESYRRRKLEPLKVKQDTLLNYRNTSSHVTYSMTGKQFRGKEMKRLNLNKPDVPEVVFETVAQVPESHAFFIHRMGLVNFSQGHLGNLTAGRLNLDLPRGVGLYFLKERGEAFTEVILMDNIYGDRVTFDVLRLRSGLDGNEVASEIADKILNTDKYEVEEKSPYIINAYAPLSGYKVEILTKPTKKKPGLTRTYYILSDNRSEFVFIVQSVEKDYATLAALMREIGRGNGLKDYDEFWNSFYLMPKNMGGDIFVAYATEKMGWNYAKAKGYAAWAKRIVGHWNYAMYFYTPGKGMWQYTVFDLLTAPYAEKTWSIYRNAVSIWREQRDFCRTRGYVEPDELSYRYDRYILTVNPFTPGNFSKNGLVTKASNFQYVCGN